MEIEILRTLPALALLAASAGASPLQDAAGLLEAQRAGLGDPSALARLGVVHGRGRLSFEGFPGQGSYTEILAPDGASRFEAVFEGMPPSLRCTNRELHWMTGTGGVEIKAGWSAAADVRLHALGRHREWREIYARAEVAGESQVSGRPCHEIRLFPKAPADVGIEVVPGEEPPAPDSWFLARDSKELVRVAMYATVSGVGWQRLLLDYSDWRTVGGVRFPHRTRVAYGPPDRPVAMEFVCESLDVDAKLPGDAFRPGRRVLLELERIRLGEARKELQFVIQQRKPIRTATVRARCAPDQVLQQVPILLPQVMAYLNRERVTPVGPPYARTRSLGAEVEIEAGIPVAEEIAGDGRVTPSSLPGGDVVSGVHVGPYRDLPRAREALGRWLVKEELTPEGSPWEVFLTEPGLERDPSKWRTEITQPVAARPGAGAPSASGGTARRSAAAPGKDSEPDAELKRFDVLVGTWDVEGGPGGSSGRFTIEWLEGGHFLLARLDLVQGGVPVKGIEVIGRERKVDAESGSAAITSRFYDNAGNTLDYTWELTDTTLLLWSGAKGSPVSYRGTFSEDKNTVTGAWKWPGGGYDWNLTRVSPPTVAAKRESGGAR
jgi:effector-binding domain-containing protein